MALVTKIKEYREQAGYKQSELAELVGARRETIVHLENADNYKVLNNGRKCKLITRKNGETVEFSNNENAENTISTSGIFSELIVEVER